MLCCARLAPGTAAALVGNLQCRPAKLSPAWAELSPGWTELSPSWVCCLQKLLDISHQGLAPVVTPRSVSRGVRIPHHAILRRGEGSSTPGCWQTVLTSVRAQGSADALEQQRGLTCGPHPPPPPPSLSMPVAQRCPGWSKPPASPGSPARCGGVSPFLCLGVRVGCRRG